MTCSNRPLLPLIILGLVVSAALITPAGVAAQRPPAGLPAGAMAQGMPAMQPPVLAPGFLEVGKEYTFTFVRSELRGKILEIDPAGWIRVHLHERSRGMPPVPWLNLYHITMIVPETEVKPVE